MTPKRTFLFKGLATRSKNSRLARSGYTSPAKLAIWFDEMAKPNQDLAFNFEHKTVRYRTLVIHLLS